MKYLRILTFCLMAFVYCLSAMTQNLVPNPSFETYTACPSSNSSEVYLATPWIEVQSTSDYYNCSSLDHNYIARTGTGYMGVAAWRPSWSETYREYVGVQLTTPLTAGVAYYGEFWVRLHPDHCWASDGMGMYVSQGQPADPPFVTCLYVSPQIMNPQYRMLIGREYWMKICGSFIANGGEDFITLGSFLDDDASTFLQLSGCPDDNFGVHWSYYHMDDVLLEQFDSTKNYDCDDTTIYNNPNEPNDSTVNCNVLIPNVYSPNGDQLNDYINTDFPLEKYTFHIYDRWGKEMYYTWEGDNRDHHWDGKHEGRTVPDGVYFYILYSSVENCQQQGTITILR
jgi:gliding motility-associated-like protein